MNELNNRRERPAVGTRILKYFIELNEDLVVTSLAFVHNLNKKKASLH
jgi:predicted transcriptional regulator